jgi:hypothetical protein
MQGGRLVSEDQEIESTGDVETIECGLVLRSIGYKSIPVEAGIPYDDKVSILSIFIPAKFFYLLYVP